MRQVLITFLILISFSGKAKIPWYPPSNLVKEKKSFFQIFGGIQQTDFIYNMASSAPGFNQKLEGNYIAGAGYRYQVGDHFSASARIAYSQQGILVEKKEHYHFDANYIGLTFPIEYQIRVSDNLKNKTTLITELGPFVSLPFSGKVTSLSYSTPLTKANIFPYDLGFEVSAGVRTAVFSSQGRSYISLRATYFRGFINTYSTQELNGTATSLNQPFYDISGTRFNQGIRLIFAIEIPFRNESVSTFTAGGDGKKTYKRFVITHK